MQVAGDGQVLNERSTMAQTNKPNRRPDGGATDQVGIGPQSIAGAEASELPDKGRGGPETDPHKQLARKLPGQTGAIEDGTDVGLTALPDIAEARDNGGRKHN
jgi:hypothetical protein